MTRRKGEITPSDLQRERPHHVALAAEKVRGLNQTPTKYVLNAPFLARYSPNYGRSIMWLIYRVACLLGRHKWWDAGGGERVCLNCGRHADQKKHRLT